MRPTWAPSWPLALALLACIGCEPGSAEPDTGSDAGSDAGTDTGPDDWTPPPDEPWVFSELPEGWPDLAIPEDEPLTRPRAELGRHLFYDTRLSGNGTQACASCHEQARAFTEGREISIGSTGEAHFRNAMTLANAGYVSALTWASRLHPDLAQQALIPMFGEGPVELGLAGRESEMLARLRAEPRYQVLFPLAFGAEPDPFTVRNVVVALAAFERTLVSSRAPYDRFVYDRDESALDPAARRGLTLFFDERFECMHCHGGFNFSSSTRHDMTVVDETTFHNTGLYDIDGRGSYPPVDEGLRRVTGHAVDMGRFRAPTLRNVELTAPYFHDGSAATLDDVLDHYSRGGRLIETGPNAGDGSTSRLRDPFVHPIEMTESERSDLSAFLRSLTDRAFVEDPRFADPW